MKRSVTWYRPVDEVSRTWWDIEVEAGFKWMGIGALVLVGTEEPSIIFLSLFVLHVRIALGHRNDS